MPSASKSSSKEKLALEFQKGELTGHLLYKSLSERTSGKNSALFGKVSKIELGHYNYWKKFTRKELRPDYFHIYYHLFLARLFGAVFTAKLLEREEVSNQKKYLKTLRSEKMLEKTIEREETAELALIRQVSEESLQYAGSIMLGMGDAIVEFTGTLAGLAFALQNTSLIAIAGLIGGISASMSMASSEYLSKKASGEAQGNPLKAAFYTGFVYFIVVFLLVLPNFVFQNAFYAFGFTVLAAFLVVLAFTYFISITQELSFKRRLLETLLLCFGIAFISFLIGAALKAVLNISV